MNRQLLPALELGREVRPGSRQYDQQLHAAKPVCCITLDVKQKAWRAKTQEYRPDKVRVLFPIKECCTQPPNICYCDFSVSVTRTRHTNQLQHVPILLESLKDCALDKLRLFIIWSLHLYSPTFNNFWSEPARVGKGRIGECAGGKWVPLIEARREEKAKVMWLASKADTIWNVLRGEVYSTLSK